MEFMAKVFAPFIKLMKSNNEQADSKVIVSFDSCIAWFEEKLLVLVWYDLHDLMLVLRKVQDSLSILKDLSAECRANGIGLSAAQVTRFTKLCDLLDMIPPLPSPNVLSSELNLSSAYESFSNKFSPSAHLLLSYAPSLEALSPYVTKTKGKLKPVEDMASSRKNDAVKFRFSGQEGILAQRLKSQSTFDSSFIRQEVKTLQLLLDDLEVALASTAPILQYIQAIRVQITKPYLELKQNMTLLPDAQELERLLALAEESYAKKSGDYEALRNEHALLRSVAAWQRHFNTTGQTIITYLHSTGITLEEKAMFSRLLQAIPLLSDSQKTSSEDSNAVHGLRQLHRDILTNLFLISTEESIISTFSNYTPEDVNAAYRSFYQQLINGQAKEVSGSDLDGAACEEMLTSWRRWDFDLLINSHIDIQYIHQQLHELMSSENFKEAFSALQTARLTSKQSLVKYQRGLEHYRTILHQHERILLNVEDFKLKFEKIAKSELQLDVTLQ